MITARPPGTMYHLSAVTRRFDGGIEHVGGKRRRDEPHAPATLSRGSGTTRAHPSSGRGALFEQRARSPETQLIPERPALAARLGAAIC